MDALAVALTLCFPIVCATAARGESKTGKSGNPGVVMVTPICPDRPGQDLNLRARLRFRTRSSFRYSSMEKK